MKITLEIPDEMRCLCISGVKKEDGELLLVVKLLMGKFLLTRNEANYVAEIVRISDRRKS